MAASNVRVLPWCGGSDRLASAAQRREYIVKRYTHCTTCSQIIALVPDLRYKDDVHFHTVTHTSEESLKYFQKSLPKTDILLF